MSLIPGIGVAGLYSLQAPFAAKLLPDTAYTCVAVRKLEDIVAAGADPRALYYEANGLDNTVYVADLTAGVCIVSLQAEAGELVYVPSSFITAMPNQGGVPYTAVVIAVSLGAVPDSLDLSYLKQKIADTVSENLGISAPELHTVAISPTTNVSQEEHATVEAARLTNKTNSTTDYAQLLQVTAERDAMAQRIQLLEQQLAAHMTA